MSKHCLHTFRIKIIIIPRLPDLREFVYVHLQAAVAAAPYISALSQGPSPLVLGTTTPTVASIYRLPRVRTQSVVGVLVWPPRAARLVGRTCTHHHSPE